MKRKSLFGLIVLIALGGCCRKEEPYKKTTEQSFQKTLSSIPDFPAYDFTAEQAQKFADLSLTCAEREYPNKPGFILESDKSLQPPRKITPVFFGCFDWHSAVHGHWTLVRLIKRFPALQKKEEIRTLLDSHLTKEKFSTELDYFKQKRNNTFERPYGYGWLLRLASELHSFKDRQAQGWYNAIRPLAQHLSEKSTAYFNTLSVPIREGTHSNTAFAMVHMLDYAKEVGDLKLQSVIEKRAVDFYRRDNNCPLAYEPSGEDFISPCLTEADLMRRVLQKKDFKKWFARFMPNPDSPQFHTLMHPVEIKNLKDPRIGHLIGLWLQRAWCLEGIAASLGESDPRHMIYNKLARSHRHLALQQMFNSGYGGEHWLASFAVYLMTKTGSGL